MTLETKVQEGLPNCPIFNEIKDKNLQTCDIVTYGIPSNNCAKCEGSDRDCKLYGQWHYHQAYYGVRL